MSACDFTIRYLRANSVHDTLEKLLNFENIRRNVDDFFLTASNLSQVSKAVQTNNAIAYIVKNKENNDVAGCLLAFRRKDKLYAHFLFRLYPGLDATDMSWIIIPKMVRFFDRKKIFVSQVVGQIPIWNKAAVKVCLNIGAVDMGIHDKIYFHEDGREICCRELIYRIPEYLHSKKFRNNNKNQ